MAAVIDGLETCRSPCVRRAGPSPGRRRPPRSVSHFVRSSGMPRPSSQSRRASTQQSDSRANSCARRERETRIGQRGRSVRHALRRADDVDADPGHDRHPALRDGLRFQEDTGEFRAAQQHIVRPFQLGVDEERAQAPRTSATPAAKPSVAATGGATVDHLEHAGRKIAARRNPGAIAPSAPGGLVIRHQPQRPLLAGLGAREPFRVGRADAVERNQPVARGLRLRAERERHQNSDFAAADAADTSGEG